MKKFTFLVVVIFVLTVVGQALAVCIKPAKSICWTLSGSGDLDGTVLVLTTKSSGQKVKTADGIIKYYSVQGNMIMFPTPLPSNGFFPVNGSGYIARLSNPTDPQFFASLQTTIFGEMYGFELYWYVASNEMNFNADRGASTLAENYTGTPTNCKMYNITNK